MKLTAAQKSWTGLFLLVLLGGILLAAGCVQDSGQKTGQAAVPTTQVAGTSGPQGLQIVLKDPGMPNVKYLQPNVTEIQLQDKDGQWVTIWSDPEGRPTRLTPDGAEMVLDTVNAPGGTYVGTRLKVSTIDVEVDINGDGDTSDLNQQIVLTLDEFNKLPAKEKPSAPSGPPLQGGAKPTPPEKPTPPPQPSAPEKPGKMVGATAEEKPSKPAEPTLPPEPAQPTEPAGPGGGTGGTGPGVEPTPPYTIVGDLVYMDTWLDEKHTVTIDDYITPLGEDMWKTDFVYDGNGGSLVYDFSLHPLQIKGQQITVNVTYRPPPPNAVSSLALSPDLVTGGTLATGTVILMKPAGTNGQVVQLSATPAGSVILPQNITVPAGAISGSFSVVTPVVTAPVNVTVAAWIGDSLQTATLTINPPAAVPSLSSLAISPASVPYGDTPTGTVTLDLPAPAGGQQVRLSPTAGFPAIVPDRVMVNPGQTSATFRVTTMMVTAPVNVTITATLNNVQKTAQVTVNPAPYLSALMLRPSSVTGGSSSIGTVYLSGPAGTMTQPVLLSASSNTYVTFPATLTIKPGEKEGSFTITTKAVPSFMPVTMTAAFGNARQSAGLSILPQATPTPQATGAFDVIINSLTCTWSVKTGAYNVKSDCVRVISNGTAKGPVGARLELPILEWSDDTFDCGSWTYKAGALIAVGGTCTRGANQPESTAWKVDTGGNECPTKSYFASSITHTVKIYNDNEITPQDTDSQTAKCG